MEPEPEPDPLDPRVALDDWQRRFDAWEAEARRAMLRARRPPEYLATPITIEDECEPWNAAFSSQTVADMKRHFQRTKKD